MVFIYFASPIFPAVRVETQFSDFLDGLGPAQLVGRQTLATPSMGEAHYYFNGLLLKYIQFTYRNFQLSVICCSGDVQIGLMDKKGQLEVEVIRARGLTPKPGSKSLPGESSLMHVYLLLRDNYPKSVLTQR